jgi:WD40 repeat protein
MAAFTTNTVDLLELSNPKLERTFKGHKNYVTSVSFSPTQRQLASGGGDYSIMMWNFRPQLRAFRYLGHKVSFHTPLVKKAASVIRLCALFH